MKKALLLVVLLVASIGCVSEPTQSEPAQVDQTVPSIVSNNSDMTDQLLMLTEENLKLKQQLDEMNLTFEHYKSELLAYQERLREHGVTNASGFYGAAQLDGPAVRQWIEQQGTFPFTVQTVKTEGQLITISVEINSGKGRVLVVTNPRMGTIFQDAANTAVLVAENRTNMSMAGSDVIFSVNGSEISGVDGPSAGALMTVLMISALENKSLNQSVTMTGTISQDGHVGAIGGVIDKAQAAKDNGKTLLLLPKENSQLVSWQEQREKHGQVTYIRRVPVYLDAKEFIEENVGISVEYVESIEEALDYFSQG